ncbi:extracellular solute-binding protein [Streptomyces sp. NPDC008150]|uniref:ABC transporter substrate-binding protein n=1 Tax=Streptomyces sp. NPDC008150 TaxID=3364816 RepID=UPI0036F0CBC9
MRSSVVRVLGVGCAAAMAFTVAGCGGQDTKNTGASGASSLTFWGWAPGYADAVKAYNASHPDSKVVYQAVQPGAKGGYQKMLNAVKAGNAPCLAQVGYETLPSFAAQGALQDVTKYATADKGDYQEAAWKSVTLGGQVYGAPLDTGPMALFYNKEVFDSLGLKPPTTWAEYRSDALKIHAADPHRYISSPYLDYDYAGLAWQAGADWFGVKGDAWQVTLDSSANNKVADYWQKLADDHLISSAPMYDQAWYTGLGNGDIATVVGAVWQAGVIKGGAKDGSGKWAVAPMPQWKAGEQQVGNAGGSATAVLKGCADPEAAWDFAHWLSTDPTTFGTLVDKAALYPAATKLLGLPQLGGKDPYFGGQNIYGVFADASGHVGTGWTWGPLMTKTSADLDDGLGKAWAGRSTISDALRTTQDLTLTEMEKQGLNTAK